MVEKIGLANIFDDSGLENVAMLIFPFFPQISEKVLEITKMVEKNWLG